VNRRGFLDAIMLFAGVGETAAAIVKRPSIKALSAPPDADEDAWNELTRRLAAAGTTTTAPDDDGEWR